MTPRQAKKKLGLSNKWIADKYGYSSVKSYNKSAGKKRIENLILEIVKKLEL